MASTPFTKGKKGEGQKGSTGKFRQGTGGFTATGATRGTMAAKKVKTKGK